MVWKHIKHAVNVVRSLLHEHEKKTERSPKWPGVEHAFKKTYPFCAACSSHVRIQVHHCKPFHLHPELELDPDNLISLCMGPNECHLLIGHGDNFKMYNPYVRDDAAEADNHPGRIAVIQAKAKQQRLST